MSHSEIVECEREEFTEAHCTGAPLLLLLVPLKRSQEIECLYTLRSAVNIARGHTATFIVHYSKTPPDGSTAASDTKTSIFTNVLVLMERLKSSHV